MASVGNIDLEVNEIVGNIFKNNKGIRDDIKKEKLSENEVGKRKRSIANALKEIVEANPGFEKEAIDYLNNEVSSNSSALISKGGAVDINFVKGSVANIVKQAKEKIETDKDIGIKGEKDKHDEEINMVDFYKDLSKKDLKDLIEFYKDRYSNVEGLTDKEQIEISERVAKLTKNGLLEKIAHKKKTGNKEDLQAQGISVLEEDEGGYVYKFDETRNARDAQSANKMNYEHLYGVKYGKKVKDFFERNSTNIALIQTELKSLHLESLDEEIEYFEKVLKNERLPKVDVTALIMEAKTQLKVKKLLERVRPEDIDVSSIRQEIVEILYLAHPEWNLTKEIKSDNRVQVDNLLEPDSEEARKIKEVQVDDLLNPENEEIRKIKEVQVDDLLDLEELQVSDSDTIKDSTFEEKAENSENNLIKKTIAKKHVLLDIYNRLNNGEQPESILEDLKAQMTNSEVSSEMQMIISKAIENSESFKIDVCDPRRLEETFIEFMENNAKQIEASEVITDARMNEVFERLAAVIDISGIPQLVNSEKAKKEQVIQPEQTSSTDGTYEELDTDGRQVADDVGDMGSLLPSEGEVFTPAPKDPEIIASMMGAKKTIEEVVKTDTNEGGNGQVDNNNEGKELIEVKDKPWDKIIESIRRILPKPVRNVLMPEGADAAWPIRKKIFKGNKRVKRKNISSFCWYQ